jgi:hypothetical protein
LALQVLCLQLGAGLAFFYCPQCVAFRFSPECQGKTCCAPVKSCCAKKSKMLAKKSDCCVKIQLPDAEGVKSMASLPATEKLHLPLLTEAGPGLPAFARSAEIEIEDGPDPPPRPWAPSGRQVLLRSSLLLI